MKRHLTLTIIFLAILTIGLFMLINPADAAADRGRAAPQSMLPEELKKTAIKDYFIRSTAKEAGFIHTIVGHVVVAREDLRQAYFAAPGDKLFEKDVVFTLNSSRCRFKLNGHDVVTMGENARVGVKSFSDDKAAKTKSSTFSMTRGKAMYYSLRLFKYKSSSMSVETPTAVVGVRGTDFGMDLDEGIKKEEAFVLKGEIDYSKRDKDGKGKEAVAVIHVFDGSVDVTSTKDGRSTALGAGQSLQCDAGGLGTKYPTPPDVARAFRAATEAPTPGGGAGAGGETKGAAGGTGTGAGTGTGTGTDTTTPPDTSSITQNQTTKDVQARPVTHTGYGTGMVTENNSGTISLYKIMSTDNREDFDNLQDVGGTGDHMSVQGATTSAPTLTELIINSQGGKTDRTLSKTELGYNAYMEWGYWTEPTAVTISSKDYYFDNRGYYLWGDVTTDAQMASLKNSGLNATYSGNAYGTNWTSSGGVNMTGTFSCNVNFATPSVSNFNMSVSGGGKSASISGASGTFSGSTSQFTLSPGSGTWTINSMGADTKSGIGSVYGANGEAIGGIWSIKYTGDAAHGSFQGKR